MTFSASANYLPMASTSRLLQSALPLIRTHGFTRQALAASVLHLPTGQAHAEPLSDTAVSSLFGEGDEARRKLIRAWLDEGLRSMRGAIESKPSKPAGVRDVLQTRLTYNEDVLDLLPEAFALLASPRLGIPPLNPAPLMTHVFRVADEACAITGDQSLQLDWYARRGSLAAAYAAAELHQLSSPKTATLFLNTLLDSPSNLTQATSELGLYGAFIFRSWRGILKSTGL